MSKVTFKELADNVGYTVATDILATAHDLRAFVEQADAERTAQGRPTLAEEAEEAIDALLERYEAGELDNYPELIEIALMAIEERAAKK